jgi:hypothetical protein
MSKSSIFSIWLVDSLCAKYGLETWFCPIDDILKGLLDMKHGWTKNAFWDVNNKKCVNGVSLFHLYYLITLMANLCSQWKPNVLQIMYIMFDWSNYRLFELNRKWTRDSLQIVIFVYVCSTCTLVELKTRFETLITRNDVKGISFFTFLI